jgi:hypothetical protein
VSYIRHYVQGLKWCQNRSEVIIRRLQAINSPIKDLPMSLPEAQRLLTHHTNMLKTMQSSSQALRSTYLVNLPSKPSSKINRHEIALRTWRTIRFLKDTAMNSTLDKLEIPANWPPPFTPIEIITSLPDPKLATEWITITTPREIEYYLQLRNRLHFGQAKNTPFAQQPLRSTISWEANTPDSELILDGLYIALCGKLLLVLVYKQECCLE